MRRAALAELGIQLPLLPTVVVGALPPRADGDWPRALERLGLDVISTGHPQDTTETLARARAAVPHRPVKCTPGDAAGLVAAGCRLLEADDAPSGAYALSVADTRIPVVGAEPAVEGADEVAAQVLHLARTGDPSAAWVTAGPGLHVLDADRVERKLLALVEGTRRARLWLAKQQFDMD